MLAMDHYWMAEALRLAVKGRYSTHPNPAVGCVITRNGQLLASGYHQVAGQPHAEINAINSVDVPAGCEFFVTLEPCSHQGKTGPCVEAVIATRPSRVVVAMEDPDPRVSGRGISSMQQAGIAVVVGVLQKEAEHLNRGFIKRMSSGKPWISLKLACSLDGRTALGNGVSQWITGEAARRDVQYQRASAAAILSSSDTVIADQARLNLRLDADSLEQSVPVRQPVRVIIDRQLKLTGSEALFDESGDIWIYTLQDNVSKIHALKSKGAIVIQLQGKDSDQQLDWLTSDLASREINSVHCECGPGLGGALLEAGQVDQLVLYQAPCLLGDKGKPLVCLGDIYNMENRFNLHLRDHRFFDQDSRMIFTPE